MSWLLKSRKRLPSGVQNQTPFAPATGMGSTFDCADHSKIVWRFVRATISSPFIAPVTAIVVVISISFRLHPGRLETPVHRRPPSVHEEHGPRHVARGIGHEEQRGGRDLLGPGPAAEDA